MKVYQPDGMVTVTVPPTGVEHVGCLPVEGDSEHTSIKVVQHGKDPRHRRSSVRGVGFKILLLPRIVGQTFPAYRYGSSWSSTTGKEIQTRGCCITGAVRSPNVRIWELTKAYWPLATWKSVMRSDHRLSFIEHTSQRDEHPWYLWGINPSPDARFLGLPIQMERTDGRETPRQDMTLCHGIYVFRLLHL